MAQEEKKLLLVDLCARLSYGVIAKYKSREKEGNVKITYGNIGYVAELGNGWWKECKPYLRPMSSMTEEEVAEFETISEELLEHGTSEEIWDTVIDWLNAHHFDHRHLIEKGLALEAPEGMYNLNK